MVSAGKARRRSRQFQGKNRRVTLRQYAIGRVVSHLSQHDREFLGGPGADLDSYSRGQLLLVDEDGHAAPAQEMIPHGRRQKNHAEDADEDAAPKMPAHLGLLAPALAPILLPPCLSTPSPGDPSLSWETCPSRGYYA